MPLPAYHHRHPRPPHQGRRRPTRRGCVRLVRIVISLADTAPTSSSAACAADRCPPARLLPGVRNHPTNFDSRPPTVTRGRTSMPVVVQTGLGVSWERQIRTHGPRGRTCQPPVRSAEFQLTSFMRGRCLRSVLAPILCYGRIEPVEDLIKIASKSMVALMSRSMALDLTRGSKLLPQQSCPRDTIWRMRWNQLLYSAIGIYRPAARRISPVD